MKYFFFIFSILFCLSLTAQVRMTGTNINSSNSSAFIDASSNSTNNNTTGTGKGLVFPRVDLTIFTFVGGNPTLPVNFPSRFDGMIVYNTNNGGVAAVGNTLGTLTPGFWFYENRSTSVNGGTWKPIGSSATAVNNVLAVTTATYTALSTDGTLLVDVPTGGATVTLPAASSNNGKVLTIKKVDDDEDVLTFNIAIKVTASESFTTLNYATTLKIQSDGTNWWLIN